MQGAYSTRYNLTKFLFPAAILLCFIIAYWTSYQKMSQRWDNGDNNYCYLVVPLFAYLLWDKRNRRAQGPRLKAENANLQKDGRGRKDEGRETGKLDDGRERKDEERWRIDEGR